MNKAAMKKKVKALIENFLKLYKPLDQKLRVFPLYKKLSQKLHRKLNTLKASHNSTAQHYYNMYEHISVEKGTVLLDSFWGRKIGCNPYAIYRAMQSDPRCKNFTYIWVKNKGIAAPEEVQTAPNVRFVEYNSKEHAEALLRAEILIANSNLPIYYIPREGQRFYNPWHGIPIKKMGFDADIRLASVSNTQRNFNMSEAIFMAGDYAVKKTIAPYKAIPSAQKIHKIGSPRIDLMLSANKTKIREELGVIASKKILLFAPTWRENNHDISIEIDAQIEAYKQLKRVFGKTHHILVSIHNYTYHRLKYLPEVSYIPFHIDTNEVLSVVDILISDYSSIIIDYLPLDRPIILFTPDRHEYETTRGLYLQLEELPVTIATNLEQLICAVSIAKKPSHFDTWQQTIDLLIPHEDGQASQRAVDLIFQENKVDIATKKTILFYPGGLLANGITSSFLSLLHNFDYQCYEVFVLVDAHTVDKDPIKVEMFDRIDSRANIIIRSGKTGYSTSEKAAYSRFITKDAPEEDGDTIIINNIMKREARRIIGDRSFDIVVDFSGYSPFWAKLLSEIPSSKKVIFQHNDLMAEATNPHNHRDQSQLLKVFKLYSQYDVVLSASKEVRIVNSKSLSTYYKSSAKILHAKNTLDINRILTLSEKNLPHDILKTFNSMEGTVRFITIARLSPEKNQKRLLEAFAKVIRTGINAQLFIVGYGPLEGVLKNKAKQLGIDAYTIFTGRLANPYSLLKKCDCFVLSSDYEGQGIVLLEALTLGIPCISTDTPPTSALLGNGLGVVCPPNADALANAMIEFANHPKLGIPFNKEAYNQEAMEEFYNAIQ